MTINLDFLKVGKRTIIFLTCPKSAKSSSGAAIVQYKKQTIIKKVFFVQGTRTLNLSLNELKLVAKRRGIKDYNIKACLKIEY